MERKNDSFVGNVLQAIQKRFTSRTKKKRKKAGLTWYRIKYLKHLPHGKPSVYTFNGNEIHFRNGSELLHSLREIFMNEIYKIQFDKPDPYIVDCGANIGLSVLYQLFRYPKARIIAFEPDKGTFGLLQQNVNQQNFPGVKLLNEAVWKEDTILKFAEEGTLGSKISNESKEGKISEVKAARLKNLLAEKIDLLKLDIEGAEYEVIKDCDESLSMAENLFIEFHGYFEKAHELTEILQIVEKNNFAFYIKEAASVYPTPFSRPSKKPHYDLQLNIFCFKKN